VVMRIISSVSIIAALLSAGMPAMAQQSNQRTLIIFGSDPCPADTICVVAPETDRYRIPKPLRESKASPDKESWAVRSQATLDQGKSGTGSCSAIGAGGWTGCWAEEMRKAREEARQKKTSDEDVP
jgi:hypothetical protein